jgi:RHS repeat-associated protein
VRFFEPGMHVLELGAGDPNCPSGQQPGAWSANGGGNACGITAGSSQYGLVAEQIDPPPAGGTNDEIVTQYLYDQDGRQVGSRTSTEATIATANWNCTTYDNADRIATQKYAAFNGNPATTVTYTYGYTYGGTEGNPLVNTVTDSNWGSQSISSTVDLLDRTVSYTDILGNTTTTSYDQAGQPTGTNGPQGDILQCYDQAGRPSAVTLTSSCTTGNPLATASYNPSGQMNNVTYANASSDALGYDSDGRLASTIITGAASTTGERDTLSPAGRLTYQEVYTPSGFAYANGTPNGTNPEYTYDAAGRLTQADLPAATYNYGFAATSGCPDNNAGENTNRTTLTVTGNGAGTTSYCYDNADRLVSTTSIPATQISYDAHGNATREGDQTFTYNVENQLVRTDSPTNVTLYTRDPLQRVVQQTSITPITEIGTTTNTATSSKTLILTDPAGVQTGDLLIASLTVGTGSLSLPSGWNLVQLQLSGNHETLVADHTAANGDPTTWTFSDTNNADLAGALTDFRNLSASPVDVTGYAADSSSTSQPLPQVTTTGNAETLLHVVGYNADVTGTAPTADTPLASTSTPNDALEVSDGYQDLPGQSTAESATSSAATASAAITVALIPTTSTQRLGYTGETDTSAFTQNTAGAVIGTSINLPGGATYTTAGSTITWSYTSLHGDTITMLDNNANLIWTGYWGPYGENASGSIPPDNTALTGDTYGYNGAQNKLTNTNAGITLMGARIYQTSTGRFLTIDPVQGGCANLYTYAYGDPVNDPDLSGEYAEIPQGGGGTCYEPAKGSHHTNWWDVGGIIAGFASLAVGIIAIPSESVALGFAAAFLGAVAVAKDSVQCISGGPDQAGACATAFTGLVGSALGLGAAFHVAESGTAAARLAWLGLATGAAATYSDLSPNLDIPPNVPC